MQEYMEEVRELGRQAKRYPGLLVHVPTPDGGKVWIESGSKGFLVPHAAWVTVPDGRKRWITSNEEVAFAMAGLLRSRSRHCAERAARRCASPLAAPLTR